jgi:hypothetical protein
MIWNARFDCLAYNRLADLVFEWGASTGPFARNFVWRSFLDSAQRSLFVGSEELLRNGVGMFRARYATHVGESGFEMLLRELLQQSAEFNLLWHEYQTASLAPIEAVLNHAKYGRLKVHAMRLIPPSLSEHTLIFLPPADDATAGTFKRLSSTDWGSSDHC